MQEIEESFTYTTLFMLKINLLFGSRRDLSLIEVLEGRKVLEYDLREDGICFFQIDEQEEFMKFLDECQDLLYYKDGSIVLRDDITVYDIDEAISKIKVFRYLDYTVNIFKYLKILKPIDLINKHYEFECVLEQLYMDNDNGKNNKEIEILFEERNSMLKDITISDDDYIDCLTSLQEQMYENKEDSYILFPINISRYETSDHYDDNNDLLNLINNPFQAAIFTLLPLYRTRVRADFNKILDDMAEEEYNSTQDYCIDDTEEYYDATFDNSDYDSSDSSFEYFPRIEEAFPDGLDASLNLSRKETVMALYYIKVLEDMKKNYKNISYDIDTIIKRVKYIIDNNEIKLYENNYDIDSIITQYIKKEDLDFIMYADEVAYFINEIFNTYYDRFYLHKLAFIKAYYELTNDFEIINYINQFKDSTIYKEVYQVVTGRDVGKIKKR